MAKFHVNYTFQGRGSELVEAASKQDAENIIRQRVEADGFLPPIDDLDDIDFDVYEMHPVTRDGRKIWTSFVLPTDRPGHDDLALARGEAPQ